ncbi:uncharacterized protein LOC127450579 [Myxocyprinus asiaticus]|uniref:uncharacterized protein LOC127450579 n=1 Tax=Myxocyprinus asiaticus TaxID=70543 RepID=UPI002222A48E|nr:uncharacterized protein LOC127450579 [Myxocyprinus asiaticus]
METHTQHVRQVLQSLKDNLLFAKAEKCEFHHTTISFLGYILSSKGVEMDNLKVQAVQDWPCPKSVKELQCFLDLANFYRRFIRNFSLVAAPFTSLFKGQLKRLQWHDAAIQAIEELKTLFTCFS